VRIALHGTNDFPKDIMKRCIRVGVSKVNVNKLILDDYLQHLQKNASKLSLTVLMEEGVKEVQKMMEWQVDVCGSSGKA
jgi:fructose-bisphosphate aldolase class II